MLMDWAGGRVVEGARLERVYRGNSIEGSNPSLSATPSDMANPRLNLIMQSGFARSVISKKKIGFESLPVRHFNPPLFIPSNILNTRQVFGV